LKRNQRSVPRLSGHNPLKYKELFSGMGLAPFQEESECLVFYRHTLPGGSREDDENLCLAIVAFALLATPALAQKGRSNKGGATRGDARADQVQATNKKQDKDRDPSPDNDKNKGKHKGDTKGKHLAKGHRH
jgi:hypothetical protein